MEKLNCLLMLFAICVLLSRFLGIDRFEGRCRLSIYLPLIFVCLRDGLCGQKRDLLAVKIVMRLLR